MFYFDTNYLLLVFIPSLLLSFLAQMFVRNAYSKWSKVRNGAGLTGAQVAQRIISATGLGRTGVRGPGGVFAGAGAQGISLGRIQGELTDHYDPQSNTVRLSDAVANQPSVVAMAVAAHELGHAQQHEQRSILIQMRSFLIPAVRLSPMVSYGLILMGFLLRADSLLWLGILAFSLVVIFSVLTLPVEIDASRRGLQLLNETGLLQTTDDSGGSRQVLTAAALTYVAAAVTAVLQLLYYISLAQRRN